MHRKIFFVSILFAALCLGAFSPAFAQEGASRVEMDAQGNKVLLGRITEKMLANDSAFLWFFTGVNRYRPDTAWTKYISAYRDSFDVVVFAGTWCEDSKRLLPQFYRVMLSSSYPASRIQLYGVDRQNHSPGGEEKPYDLVKTPTIILLRHGQELGRIVEKANRSVEADMVMILDRMFAPAEAEDSSSTP